MFPSSADRKAGEPLEESPSYKAFKKFALLTARKKQLNALLTEIKTQLKNMEPILLGYFGENGYDMVKVEGFTISPKRVPWVYPRAGLSRGAVIEALKISDLGRYVRETYNTRSLTAYVRELEQHYQLFGDSEPEALEQLLPQALAQVVEVRPSFELQVLDRREGVKTDARFEEEEFNPEEGEYDAE